MDARRRSGCEHDTLPAVVGGLCAVCLLRRARAIDYTMINVLGCGDSGITYVAERSGTRGIVAVKVANRCGDPRAVLESVRQAADALGALPDVSGALDAGLLEGRVPYVVRPYVRGVAITTFCRRRAADREVRRHLLATVQQVVARAHARGITHGNLAAGNIFVRDGDSGPIVTIADFGMRVGSKEADLVGIERLTVALL